MLLRIFKLLLAGLFYVMDLASRSLRALSKRTHPGTLVVLMYHSVKPEQRIVFGKHMEALLRAGSPVSTACLHSLENDRHHIAITFDDGFQSFVENVLPALVERNLPATCFIPAGYLGQKPGWIRRPDHENANETLMTEDQLRRLPDPLITIGSHGMTHPRLTEIGLDKVRGELIDSKRTLEGILRRPVTLLSFPHGSCDETIVALAKQAGYQRVFLNVPTFPASITRGYVVGRIDMLMDDWRLEYRLKLAGAYQWLPLAMRLKCRLARCFPRKVRTKV